MAITERRRRDPAVRRASIVAAARALAEREGWDAVTTRRLSTEIEYSQPVIYQHFRSMEDLADTIALDGFTELAEALSVARREASANDVLGAVARTYAAFADTNRALYEAMFTRASRLRFGADSVRPLRDAFAELRAAVTLIAGPRDVDTATELFWAALHGLVSLGHHNRLRASHIDDRLKMLVAYFGATNTAPTPATRSRPTKPSRRRPVTKAESADN